MRCIPKSTRDYFYLPHTAQQLNVFNII